MFAGVLSAAAQQDTVRTQAPDNDAILRETINSASPYYYPTLFTRYLTGDTTLTDTDYRYLYYGFVWRPEYKPFETPAAQLAMLRKIALYGLADDYVKRNEQTLKDMTLDEAKQVIGQYIDFDRMTIVIVGDAKTQLAGVRSLGLGDLVVVDSQGKPVK